MNRRERRARTALGVPITPPPAKVEAYTGDKVDSDLVLSLPVEDLLIPLFSSSDPRKISRPGETAKLKVYDDPNHVPTEEQPLPPKVRGYRRHVHSVMYRGTNGLREYMPPTGLQVTEVHKAAYEQAFERLVKDEGLRLVTRQEKRTMWKEERARRRDAAKKSTATLIVDDEFKKSPDTPTVTLDGHTYNVIIDPPPPDLMIHK